MLSSLYPPRTSALGDVFRVPPLPAYRGTVWGDDGLGIRYRFDIYDLDAITHGVDAVYAFARYEAGTYEPLYIGRAGILSQRLTGHECRAEARRRGATALLVHIPGPHDPVSYGTAEERLIRHYAPPLNERFNALAGLRGF
jgi:hypothetical protein